MEAATVRSPRVAIRYFDECPNWRTAYLRLNEVLAESGYEHVAVALELIETPEEAERLRFIGSPTILVDRDDRFVGDATGGFGLSCRIYGTPEGSGVHRRRNSWRKSWLPSSTIRRQADATLPALAGQGREGSRLDPLRLWR